MPSLTSTLSTLLRPDLALTGLFALIFAAVAVYASAIPQGKRSWWAYAGLMAVLVLAALQFQSEVARVILLDLAALAAVALVWSQSPQAGRTYLWMAALGMACVAVGLLLGGAAEAAPAFPMNRIAAALIILGFALKLALVPFYFWLPGVATSSTPMTTAIIVATLDMAEFGELITLRQTAPWVFTDHFGLWIGLALLSMFGGALLALAQRDIKRMLAFSTIDDMGYLLLGVLVGAPNGLMGAFFGLVSHALCKTLLFGAVGIAENTIKEPLNLDCRGLATRFPVSSAMFITGSLGMLGVPPLVGFLGRWRLYLSAVETGGFGLALAMVVATGLALFYYVRAIHKVWLGTAPGRPDEVTKHYEHRPAAEPLPAAAALIVLAVVALALGLFPTLIQGLLG